MIKIVPATAEMMRPYIKGGKSARALAAVEDGKVLGIGGLFFHDSGQVMFSWIGEELKKHPRIIIKAWKMIEAMAMECRVSVLAQCDYTIPKAESMLLHFGFFRDGDIWRKETW